MRFIERFKIERLKAALSNVRLDAAALGPKLAALRATVPGKAAAVGAAALASTAIVYAIWPVPAERARVDAVVTAATPVFTPVAWKPAVAAPAAAATPEPGDDVTAISAGDTIALVRAVQRQLKRAGCYGGRVDGRWNAATRRAMGAFTGVVNARLPVDQPDPVLLVLLETHQDASCGQAPGQKQQLASIAPDIPAEPEIATRSDAEPAEAAPSEPDAHEAHAAVKDEPDTEAVMEPSSVSATEAASVATAAATAVTTRKVARADRPHVKRKYRKKKSFSRTVSRNFRKLQRGFGFFW